MKRSQILFIMLYVSVALSLLFGCATAPPKPSALVAPTPILNNSGSFMCPYTQDDVVAPWVDKGINASTGAAIGKMTGAYVGSKALEQVPLVGGLFGSKAGEVIGREVAVKSCGGWDYIKATSDMSFYSLEDLTLWMYVKKSGSEHYQNVVDSVKGIYPDYDESFKVALEKANRK